MDPDELKRKLKRKGQVVVRNDLGLTNSELSLLAGFVCERYDTLMEIANDPNPKIDLGFKKGARRDADSLATLNKKLRLFYHKP